MTRVAGEPRVPAERPRIRHDAGSRIRCRAEDGGRRLASSTQLTRESSGCAGSAGAGPAALAQCWAPDARNSRAKESVALGPPMACWTRTGIVVDRSLREDELVGEAMPDDDLPTVLLEGGQVGVVGSNDIRELGDGLAEQLVELCVRDRLPVP